MTLNDFIQFCTESRIQDLIYYIQARFFLGFKNKILPSLCSLTLLHNYIIYTNIFIITQRKVCKVVRPIEQLLVATLRVSAIIGGSCHKYNFCRDKHVFVATKHVFSHDKSMLAATKESL